jgi:hypothetical protein
LATPPIRISRKVRAERVNRRPAGFRALIMALGIVLALAYVFFLRTPPQAPTPTVRSIQGTYTWRSEDHVGQDGTFVAVSNGNARGKASIPEGTTISSYRPPESAYVAVGRIETTLGGNVGPTPLTSRTIGAWPPVWRVATHSPLDYQGLAAIVRSAVEDSDRTIGIKPLKDGDRKVWRANMSFADSTVEVVVDQLSGIVVWYTRANAGRQDTFTATVDWTAAAPSSAALALHPPPDAKVETSRDAAYHYRPTLAAAGVTVGYTPLESTLEPDGYALRAVAVARPYQAPLALLTGNASFPPGLPSPTRDNEVAQLYTRGLTWFSLQTIAAPGTPRFAALTRRAVDVYAAHGLSAQSVALQYGAFAGATAHTWYAPDGPTLFVANDTYAVVVRGGLTRQELLSLAEGLEPLGSSGSASPSPSP